MAMVRVRVPGVFDCEVRVMDCWIINCFRLVDTNTLYKASIPINAWVSLREVILYSKRVTAVLWLVAHRILGANS